MSGAVVVEDADAHCDGDLVDVCDMGVSEMMGSWKSVGLWVNIRSKEEE